MATADTTSHPASRSSRQEKRHVETMATWRLGLVYLDRSDQFLLALFCCLRCSSVSARSLYTLQRALPQAFGRGVAEPGVKAGPRAQSGLGSVAAVAFRFWHSCSATQVFSGIQGYLNVRQYKL
jgi:hypothetical protein